MNPFCYRVHFFMYGFYFIIVLCVIGEKQVSISVRKSKNDSDLCTHACPYRLAWLGTSLRVRGKLTLRKKEIIVLYLYTLLTVSYAGFLPLPLVGYGVSLHLRVAPLLKIQFACHRS